MFFTQIVDIFTQIVEEIVMQCFADSIEQVGVDAVFLKDAVDGHSRTAKFASQPRNAAFLSFKFRFYSFANVDHLEPRVFKMKRRGVLSLVPLVEALAKPILNRTSNAEPTPVRLYMYSVQ